MHSTVQLLLCFLPAFIIEENDKFKLEVSEKMQFFFPSKFMHILNSKHKSFGGRWMRCEYKFKTLL